MKNTSGTGWLELEGFGRINPRSDNVGGGRDYFTAKTNDDGYAQVRGESVSGGPETYYFHYSEPFWLGDENGLWLRVEIERLSYGKYGVSYVESDPPIEEEVGGWTSS